MKTALYARHCALGAKMVDFCGWEMPLQYQGIIPEHHAVRERVGLFDISHMGRVLVQGKDAEKFLDYISTNKIAGKQDGSATYTVWCLPSGGCIDDVIVYRETSTHFFVVVNACNRKVDLEHLQKESRGFDVRIQDRYADEGILAIQGPLATQVLSQFFRQPIDLKNMHFQLLRYEGHELILSATGYTGAGGFEIYGSHAVIEILWDRLLDEKYGIQPVGLGARDTLRLEMGYALYGHEISPQIAANESVAAWAVKWNKPNFIGKSALEKIEKSPKKRSEKGIVMIDKGIARAGFEVYNKDKQIGIVTSGTYSPTLNQSIALALLEGSIPKDGIVEIQIRQNRCKAKIVELPFIVNDRKAHEVHRVP